MGDGGAFRALFRVVVLLHAALTLVQPVAAGAVLQASTVGLAVHQAVGGVLLLVAFVQVPVAVLAWRPGRLPAWPIAVSAGLVVVETAQVAVGATGVLAVHVPLGVAIVGAAVGLAWWAVRARPPARPARRVPPSPPRQAVR
ncbi:hypothetical protein [Actinomycetospora straminea]|uniref:Uncharacterized protein n=1 Tax=Actinomycetospora straminea TaxID=663607 RepID=A0ABP9DZG4_9PSEU|nr:hypothetical protein [Actinomycetospora straminea]MDD7935251.1 hypothetical protein [Actinomycetospora straminea]